MYFIISRINLDFIVISPRKYLGVASGVGRGDPRGNDNEEDVKTDGRPVV